MEFKSITAATGPSASGGYSQAVEVSGARRLLFVSGQIPVDTNGSVPGRFEDQARVAWKNIEKQLIAADMTLANIVKHTTFLADRKYRDVNGEIRRETLGALSPALTVVIAEIYDEDWLLEIEAIAAG